MHIIMARPDDYEARTGHRHIFEDSTTLHERLVLELFGGVSTAAAKAGKTTLMIADAMAGRIMSGSEAANFVLTALISLPLDPIQHFRWTTRIDEVLRALIPDDVVLYDAYSQLTEHFIMLTEPATELAC